MANETILTEQPPVKPKAKKITTQGRKPKRRSTKEELNRERVTAQIITCLVSGKTLEETSKELDVSFTWVERVRKELPSDFVQYFTEAKTNQISELIEELIREQLIAMIKMVKVTDDELWLKAQRAPELATFFGVINDKTVRILAAIERADEREQERRERQVISPAGTALQSRPTIATQGA